MGCLGRFGAGLHLSMRAFMVYIATVLGFVAQLEAPPADFEYTLNKAVRLLFPGPMAWVTKEVLHDARLLGFPCDLVDVSQVAIAAKSIVFRTENRRHGGLNIRVRARRLRNAADLCENWAQLQWASNWVRTNFLFQTSAGILMFKNALMRIALLAHCLRSMWNGRIGVHASAMGKTSNRCHGSPWHAALSTSHHSAQPASTSAVAWINCTCKLYRATELTAQLQYFRILID